MISNSLRRGLRDRRQVGERLQARGCIHRQLGGIALRRSGEIHRRQPGTAKNVVNLIAPGCAGGLEKTFVRVRDGAGPLTQATEALATIPV